jgi:hypothetical protein
MKIFNSFIILIIGLCFSFLVFSNKIINSKSSNTYIHNHLDIELDSWRKLFNWCFINFPDNPIFCKGGQVLAFEILKDLLNKGVSDFSEYFSLDLINDWDLNIYITKTQIDKLVNFARNFNFEIHNNRINETSYKNWYLIRSKNKIKAFSKEFYLLEFKINLNITEKQLDEYELPFTCLGFEINSGNLELFLEIMKISIKNKFGLINQKYKINQLLNNSKIYGSNLFDSVENGLFIINNPKKIQTVYLSPKMIQIINDFTKSYDSNRINSLTIKQFLINQLSYARLFYRTKKNIIKSEKITILYEKNDISLPIWLMNKQILKEIDLIVNLFLNFLKDYIYSQLVIPERPELFDIKKSIKEFIYKMEILFKNIYLSNLINKKQDKIVISKIIPLNKFEILKTKYLQNLQEEEENFDYNIFLEKYEKGNYFTLLRSIFFVDEIKYFINII